MSDSAATLRVEVAKAREKGDDAKAADLSTSPIFASLDGDAKDEIDHVIVERVAPVAEGQLGRFEPDVTEADIFERHGGGKYRVQARTVGGRPIKGLFTQVTLAGEPILRSKLARQTYKRMTAADDEAPAASSPATSMQDMLAVLEQTRASAEAERERRADEEEKRHKRELERLAAETAARAAERREDEERRRKDEEAREDRRRKEEDERRRRDKEEALEREAQRKRDDDERRSRDKREEEDRRQRDREWQVTLAQMSKSTAPAYDPVALLTQGIALAGKLGGGGGGGEGLDPLAGLAANLPQTIREIKGAFSNNDDPNNLTITGELGKKGNALVQYLASQGVDAGAALNSAFDMLFQVRGPGPGQRPGQAGQPAGQAPAPAPGGAPPAQRRGPAGRPMPPGPRPVQPTAAKDGFVPAPAVATAQDGFVPAPAAPPAAEAPKPG